MRYKNLNISESKIDSKVLLLPKDQEETDLYLLYQIFRFYNKDFQIREFEFKNFYQMDNLKGNIYF